MPDSKPDGKGVSLERPLPEGVARVEFDAGGAATFVTPNPLRPILKRKEGKEVLVLRWELAKSPLHANSGFEVIFGNVVPCHKGDPFFAGLVSESAPDGKSWTWSWPKPDQLPFIEEGILLLYDIFFLYQPKQLLAAGARPRSHYVQTQATSLRQIMSTDPTIILPPKAGGG